MSVASEQPFLLELEAALLALARDHAGWLPAQLASGGHLGVGTPFAFSGTFREQPPLEKDQSSAHTVLASSPWNSVHMNLEQARAKVAEDESLGFTQRTTWEAARIHTAQFIC